MTKNRQNQGLALDSVSVSLGGKSIIEDVSFDVKPGEVVGLIGANGAGKSTAIRAALNLVKIKKGTVSVGGVDAASMTLKDRAKLMSYVPQGTPVHWPLIAERLVALGRTPHLGPWDDVSEADQMIIKNAMTATDTWHLRDRIATTLSGGEVARLMLARTIAVGAPYMLADEPTAALDPYHRLQVMDIMREHAAKGTGILIVLHDLSFAQNYCDKLVLMHEGRVLATGAIKDVLSDQNLEAAFQVRVSRWRDKGVDYLMPSKPLSGGKAIGEEA
ncbi:ABC transporter ATP-binding protein [Kordiimonas sp. SCSIO 12610]|uniref:ABC transporter ATP-binding protein n=1 Tax=Kordiimonas sp. SCSIO 12610 TaxID=2829597 RepID=UPI00210B29F6|nr:ABC transporter ATP-binding protein [Kordiimonas sp. SCSIO 12610]UTW55930.1 ABC transporter ATP-binding protein [Kordiimonas sp. SCSIO 12610]